MIKYFKKAFSITNDNIILTTPLILFLLLIGLYMSFTGHIMSSKPSAILLLSTLLFMTSAFFAGWFYMVQKAIDISHENLETEEKIRRSLAVIKTMTTGVGNYFLSFVFGSILFIGLTLLFILAGKYTGNHFIGHVNLPFDAIKASLMSSEQMKSFLGSLPVEELSKISKWNFLILGLVTSFSFITMFWACTIIKTDKNPLFAFFKSIYFIGKNILGSIILYIYISSINFIISAINAFFASNNLLYFISTIIYFYFVVYIVVLVFLYYDEAQNTKVENNCDSGSDCLGEE